MPVPEDVGLDGVATALLRRGDEPRPHLKQKRQKVEINSKVNNFEKTEEKEGEITAGTLRG